MHTFKYEEFRQFSALIGGESLEVISKPGLPAWDTVLPSTRLLAEQSRFNPTDRVLLFGCPNGALGVVLARQLVHGQLSITDKDFLALEVTRRTLSVNDIKSVNILSDVSLDGLDEQQHHVVLMQLPKGRNLARRWLIQAHRALVEGGSLFLAGANNSGIQSTIKDGEDLFGNAQVLAYKKGNRIARLVKKPGAQPLPAWINEPGIASGTWMEFQVILSGQSLIIRSLPGVFAYDHLDPASQMLLSVTQNVSGMRVLDVGSGYGIIGMAAAIQGARWVDFVDTDLLAIASCKETLSINGIKNATVKAGDLLEPFKSNRYDLILSNPPFHTGRDVNYQIAHALIMQAHPALDPGGQIIIVANRFIPYGQIIDEIFGNSTLLAESERFHVLSGIKSG